MNPGESPEEAMYRELWEEIGLKEDAEGKLASLRAAPPAMRLDGAEDVHLGARPSPLPGPPARDAEPVEIVN